MCGMILILVCLLTMPIQTIVELELGGRGQGWTDVSSDLGDQVASAGTAKFELVNQNPAGKYSLRHANRVTGFKLGIGVRIRLLTGTPQGTGTGSRINSVGGYPAGATEVAVDSGSGSILRGDVITFAGVSGRYLVVSGSDSDPATSISFEPGLFGAVADDADVTLVERSFTRHRGRLDSVQPAAGIFERRTVGCESVDWIDDAARSKVAGLPVQLDKRADEIFTTLIGSVPFTPDAVEADMSPDTYSFALDSAQDERSAVLSELQKLALSELGLIYQKADGTLVFESRNRRAVSEGVVDTFTDVSAISGFEAPVARDDSISRVQVITHPRKVDDDNNTVLFRLDNPLQVGANASVTILGPYRDPNQEAARVGGTDMRTPVASTDYAANSQPDGLGTDLTPFVKLTPSFGGNGAKVLIENGGSATAWLTLMQLRGRGIYDYQNIVLEAEDADAQINVGTTVTADMPYQDNAALGGEIALWLLNLYQDAETLAESATVFIPRTDEALAERVLSREISDRIGIVERMTGFETGSTNGHFIQNVSLTIDSRDNLSVTWGLAPANRQQFWLLEVPGRSELDQTTALGFGLVVGHTDVSHCDTHDDAAHMDTAHDDAHGDAHADAAHVDTAHTDSHSDVVHSDTAHSDSHSDTSHSDVAHRDSHSDVSHVDSHSDTTHTDTHGDSPHHDLGPPETHEDVAHTDAHSDIAHMDSHTDVSHSDAHNDRAHVDVAHDDAHTDVAHSDVNHGDTHDDAHTDVAHSDVNHGDTHDDAHTDVAHSDVNHGDTHGDTGHGDASHGDTAHTDTHTDINHQDTPHGDDHCDVSHGDVN